MSTIAIAIPHTATTVNRNVLLGVVHDLLRVAGVDRHNDIIIKERLGQPSESSSRILPGPAVKLNNEDHVTVVYKENYVEEDKLNTVIYRAEYPYLFLDPHLGIYIRPTYNKVKMDIELQIQVRDATALSTIRRVFRIHDGISDYTGTHAVRYDYTLPDIVVAYLGDIHALREANLGYGDTISDYLNKYFFKGLVKRSNQSGSSSRLSINEQESNVVGKLNDAMFYDEIEDNEGAFIVTLGYQFEYHQISAVVLDYQLVIHNQLIPSAYRNMWRKAPYRDAYTDAETLSYMEPDNANTGITRFYLSDGGYRHDPMDTWYPSNPRPYTASVLSAPLIIDPANPRMLISLNDFTADMLDARIRDFILEFRGLCITPYEGIFEVVCYRINSAEEELTINIALDGSVSSSSDLSLRDRHYVRISVLTDPGRLHRDMILWLLQHPDFALFYLHMLDERVVMTDVNLDYIVDMLNLRIVNGAKITLDSFRDVVKGIRTTNDPYRKLHATMPKHTATFNVVTHRNKTED